MMPQQRERTICNVNEHGEVSSNWPFVNNTACDVQPNSQFNCNGRLGNGVRLVNGGDELLQNGHLNTRPTNSANQNASSYTKIHSSKIFSIGNDSLQCLLQWRIKVC